MKGKKPNIFGLLYILLSVLTSLYAIVVGFFFSALANLLPKNFNPFLGLLVFVPVFIALIVAQVIVQNKTSQSGNDRFPSFLSFIWKDPKRQQMLAKVRFIWINGLLKQSLEGLTLIKLELQDQPDAVADPWHLQLGQSDILPSDIIQIYDEAGGELLILGEPGSGKTTLLLELTQKLLDRAKSDESHLIPIVFHLSSWNISRQSLADWLIEELRAKYEVRSQVVETWVKTGKVLLLLDGLDEVAPSNRASCIEAINRYKQEHLVPVVVASRIRDYPDRKMLLHLHQAIVIQSLTTKQVDTYLLGAGERLATIHEAFQDDGTLRRIVNTPLMLSIMISAYQGVPVDDILTESIRETRRQQLFAKYVQRMLQRRDNRSHYTSEQTVFWLAWLARRMKRYELTEFYMEGLQPSWLRDNQSELHYSRAINMFISMPLAIMASVISGSVIGFLTSLLLNNVVIGRVIGGLIFLIACFAWLRIVNIAKDIKENAEIEFVEVVVISRERLQQFLPPRGGRASYGILFGFFLATCVTIARLLKGNFDLEELLMILGLFCVIVAVGIMGGLTKKKVPKKNRTRPNQGTWKSIRNSLFWGLASGVSIGGACGIGIGVLYGGFTGLICGLLIGIVPGLIYMVVYGGEAWIRHAILRLHIWRLKYAPLRYVRFLNFAVESALIYKIGGRYIFIHNELRDYFAKLISTEPAPLNAKRQTSAASSASQKTIIQKQARPSTVIKQATNPYSRKKHKRHS